MYFFAKMCRLCLGGDCELNKLISCDQINNCLLNKLSTMFPILDCTKSLPKWICHSCKRDLNTTYEFYQRCLNAHKKLEEYYDLNLKSTLLVNDKKPENDVNIIKPETETCVNKEILMSLLLATNTYGITIKNEIEDVSEYSKFSETINSNLEDRNLHEIQINEELLGNSDNIDTKTEITDGGDEYSKYNLNLNDHSHRTENYSDNYFIANNDEVSATTIFEHRAAVTKDTKLICNVNQDNLNKSELNIDDDRSHRTENYSDNYFSANNDEVSATTIFEHSASVTKDTKLICNVNQDNLNNSELNIDDDRCHRTENYCDNYISSNTDEVSGTTIFEHNASDSKATQLICNVNPDYLNKSELNIDDDCSQGIENYCDNYFSSNADEVNVTTIFEHNASVTKDTQLICNVNQDIQNRNQIINTDSLSKSNENELSQTFSVDSFEGLNTINGNRNDLTGERYQCHFCTIAFTMETFLERHLKRVHGYTAFVTAPMQIERIKNTIPMEPKKFKYSQSEKISSRPLRYKCSLCDKRFSDRSQLRIHHRIHTGERPYTCQTCKKSFNQKQHLKLHQRIHSNERPFTCDICHKSFNSRYINVHKRIHTGELPFACPICNERFNRTDKVNKHIRIKHTKEKPYLCIYCDKTFHDRTLLTRHRHKYHPEIIE